jgi:uncharacterized protein (TIGR03437 family)
MNGSSALQHVASIAGLIRLLVAEISRPWRVQTLMQTPGQRGATQVITRYNYPEIRLCHTRIRSFLLLSISHLALAQSPIAIQGPTSVSPGIAVTLTLTNGTQQLKPDAWFQGYNPDRYTGNDYVSSSAVAISPQADGGAIVTAGAPGRYKILATLNGTVYQKYLLVRPQLPTTPIRGVTLSFLGAIDRTYASEVISVLRLTNSNAAYLNVYGCMDIDSGSFTPSAWTGQSWCPGTPFTDIGWLVDTLHSNGFVVFLNVAMQARYKGVAAELEGFLSSLSDADVSAAVSGYASFSVQLAQFAQQHTAEYLVVGDNFQIYNPAVTSAVNSQWTTLLQQIRASYSGKVYFGDVFPCSASFAFAEWTLVDGIRFVPGYNASAKTCTYPPTVGVYNIHTEEMLPYIRFFESQPGFQLLRQVRLPTIWTDLYAANVDGMNSLAASVFTTQTGIFDGSSVPQNAVEDNQQDVDLFEATLRSAVADTSPVGFFLFDANIYTPSNRGAPSSVSIYSDVMMQPGLLGALTNWYGGDPTQFSPCWVDAPTGQLFQENFEANSCPLSRIFALVQQTYPNASSAQVIADPQNTTNHFLRFKGSGYSQLITGNDYTITAQVRISSDAQSNAGINFRVNMVNGYNAYQLFINASGVTLQKSVQGQNNRIQTATANIASGQWHSITITANGGLITAAIDDVALISYRDPSPLLAGQVVLAGCCNAAGSQDFDNVLVSAVSDTASAQISAIVNAASEKTTPTSPVSPGEIVVIYGKGFGPNSVISAQPQAGKFPTSLGGITVYFGTTPAPLIYVASGQIAAIVPYEISGQMNTAVQVSFPGGSTTAFTVAVVGTQPGVFSFDSSGTGEGAILNQDFSVNSPTNPAARGAVIVIYETGEGQTDPPGRDGMLATTSFPKPIGPVSVLIGGVPAKIDYAGAAPGEVAGLMQLNVEVPANAPTGSHVPVLVIVGQYISQSELTISVQ